MRRMGKRGMGHGIWLVIRGKKLNISISRRGAFQTTGSLGSSAPVIAENNIVKGRGINTPAFHRICLLLFDLLEYGGNLKIYQFLSLVSGGTAVRSVLET